MDVAQFNAVGKTQATEEAEASIASAKSKELTRTWRRMRH
jgi:hypothetical protein